MPSNILTTGNTAATAEFTVAADEQWTLALKGVDGVVPSGARVIIALKDDEGSYVDQAVLDAVRPSTSITASGTYRVERKATDAALACGVFRG